MSAFAVGDQVKVLAPFNEPFSLVYPITEVVTSEDGTTAYILGEIGGFDAQYLEAA